MADNKLALNAGWDEEMLRLEMEALKEQGHSLELAGFNESELSHLIAKLDTTGIDPDESPEPERETTSKAGDMWTLGDHIVLCADATREETLRHVLGGQRCDLVFTDPPYNVDYTGKTTDKLKLANDDLGAEFGVFLSGACRAMLRVSDGALYICMSSSQLHRLQTVFCEEGGHWSTFVLWVKDTFTLGRPEYQRQYEPILYGWKEGNKHHWCGDRNQGDVWFCDKPRVNRLHPTMKPVELIERAIRNSSAEGLLVLDPFGGSGSTIIACEKTRRCARVVEIDPRYVDVTIRRWQIYTGRDAHREGDGKRFRDVAATGLDTQSTAGAIQ